MKPDDFPTRLGKPQPAQIFKWRQLKVTRSKFYSQVRFFIFLFMSDLSPRNKALQYFSSAFLACEKTFWDLGRNRKVGIHNLYNFVFQNMAHQER